MSAAMEAWREDGFCPRLVRAAYTKRCYYCYTFHSTPFHSMFMCVRLFYSYNFLLLNTIPTRTVLCSERGSTRSAALLNCPTNYGISSSIFQFFGFQKRKKQNLFYALCHPVHFVQPSAHHYWGHISNLCCTFKYIYCYFKWKTLTRNLYIQLL